MACPQQLAAEATAADEPGPLQATGTTSWPQPETASPPAQEEQQLQCQGAAAAFLPAPHTEQPSELNACSPPRDQQPPNTPEPQPQPQPASSKQLPPPAWMPPGALMGCVCVLASSEEVDAAAAALGGLVLIPAEAPLLSWPSGSPHASGPASGGGAGAGTPPPLPPPSPRGGTPGSGDSSGLSTHTRASGLLMQQLPSQDPPAGRGRGRGQGPPVSGKCRCPWTDDAQDMSGAMPWQPVQYAGAAPPAGPYGHAHKHAQQLPFQEHTVQRARGRRGRWGTAPGTGRQLPPRTPAAKAQGAVSGSSDGSSSSDAEEDTNNSSTSAMPGHSGGDVGSTSVWAAAAQRVASRPAAAAASANTSLLPGGGAAGSVSLPDPSKLLEDLPCLKASRLATAAAAAQAGGGSSSAQLKLAVPRQVAAAASGTQPPPRAGSTPAVLSAVPGAAGRPSMAQQPVQLPAPQVWQQQSAAAAHAKPTAAGPDVLGSFAGARGPQPAASLRPQPAAAGHGICAPGPSWPHAHQPQLAAGPGPQPHQIMMMQHAHPPMTTTMMQHGQAPMMMLQHGQPPMTMMMQQGQQQQLPFGHVHVLPPQFGCGPAPAGLPGPPALVFPNQHNSFVQGPPLLVLQGGPGPAQQSWSAGHGDGGGGGVQGPGPGRGRGGGGQQGPAGGRGNWTGRGRGRGR